MTLLLKLRKTLASSLQHHLVERGEDGAVVGQVQGDFNDIVFGYERLHRAIIATIFPSSLVHAFALLAAASRDAAEDNFNHEGTHDYCLYATLGGSGCSLQAFLKSLLFFFNNFI